MRKRNVQILFRLTEEEAEQLYSLVKKSGCSKEAFLRGMVKGYRLCEKPDPEFYKMMRELSAIGNRINQLAAKANNIHSVSINYIPPSMHFSFQETERKYSICHFCIEQIFRHSFYQSISLK